MLRHSEVPLKSKKKYKSMLFIADFSLVQEDLGFFTLNCSCCIVTKEEGQPRLFLISD